MSEPSRAQLPLAIDRVERVRAKKDQVRLRLTGHWVSGDRGGEPELEALLVVQMHGRRHRFAASREKGGAPPTQPPGPGFAVSFTIPDWAVPEQPGQAVLWIGDAVVAVPPPGASVSAEPVSAPAGAPPADPDEPAAPAWVAPPAPAQVAPPAPAGDVEAQGVGRAGPLAELLFKETVSALHAELEQRAAEAARLRGALARAHSDLEVRAGTQSGLEVAHAELREELARLMAAVSEQRREFDDALTTARGERDEALATAETERHEALATAETERDEALAMLRAEHDESLAAMRAERDAARAELAETRAELAENEAMLGAVHAQTDARVQMAEARARELGERASALQADERRRGEEISALREQLAAAQVTREAALGEAGGLRAELERLGGELGAMREHGEGPGDDLTEARRLLADARALTEQLRSDLPG